MDTKEVADRLVALCKEGKNLQAIDELYSPDIVSVEAGGGSPEMPAEMKGIDAIRGKNQWWYDNHEIHSGSVEGPYPNPNADKFAAKYVYEVTAKTGPMAGNRFTMEEIAVYTVEDGKIAREEFFYSM